MECRFLQQAIKSHPGLFTFIVCHRINEKGVCAVSKKKVEDMKNCPLIDQYIKDNSGPHPRGYAKAGNPPAAGRYWAPAIQ